MSSQSFLRRRREFCRGPRALFTVEHCTKMIIHLFGNLQSSGLRVTTSQRTPVYHQGKRWYGHAGVPFSCTHSKPSPPGCRSEQTKHTPVRLLSNRRTESTSYASNAFKARRGIPRRDPSTRRLASCSLSKQFLVQSQNGEVLIMSAAFILVHEKFPGTIRGSGTRSCTKN